MKVFVVVVSYNGMKWIERCLSSLFSSSLDIQVVVVDNASTDNTTNIIKERYKNVTLLIQPENIGFGKANNIGLSLALKERCDFVFLLNQDAFVKPETIEVLIKASQNNSKYGIISPIHLNGTGNCLDKSFLYYLKNEVNNDFLNDFILNVSNKKELYEFRMVNAAAWLIPVHTLKVVGGFNPMFFLYGEDDNYCQRVHFHGLKIGVSPNTFIYHDSNNNIHAEIIEGSKRYFEIFLNRIKIKYGNVNSEDFKKLKTLKKFFIKQAVSSLLQLRIKDFQKNLNKNELIKNLNFTSVIVEDRKRNSNYL